MPRSLSKGAGDLVYRSVLNKSVLNVIDAPLEVSTAPKSKLSFLGEG